MQEMTRDKMAEEHGEELLFLSEDFFDNAIIGITYNSQVVYDMDRMIELFSENNDCDTDEAIEYLSFNTWSAYVGEQTPVFVRGKLA
jgi:hypothetical protein